MSRSLAFHGIFSPTENSCRVSGKPCHSLHVREARRPAAIQIHGQNHSQQLFDEATDIGYLDLYCHDGALRQAYDKVSVVQQEIRRLSMN